MLLMEEILHQLIGSLSNWRIFLHPRWCISFINSVKIQLLIREWLIFIALKFHCSFEMSDGTFHATDSLFSIMKPLNRHNKNQVDDDIFSRTIGNKDSNQTDTSKIHWLSILISWLHLGHPVPHFSARNQHTPGELRLGARDSRWAWELVVNADEWSQSRLKEVGRFGRI